MSGAVDSDLNQLRAEVSQLRGDLSHIAQTLQSLARHGAADTVEHVRKSHADMQEAVRAKTAGISQEIEENPLAAALASFAIGALLGALVGGRR